MKLRNLFLPILFVTAGCQTSFMHKEKIGSELVNSPASESKNEILTSIKPTPQTRVVVLHVQSRDFSSSQEHELAQALNVFGSKCWILMSQSQGKNPEEKEGPEYCVKFQKFSDIALLKPYKRYPTDKKMLLTALDAKDHFRVQNFVWDGAKLQRVRNSDSSLRGRALNEFLYLWALK